MCCLGSCAGKLMALFKSIQGCLKSISEEFELTVPEMMIMLELYENKVLSLNELSEKIQLPKSSASRIIDQLVSKGYVIRKIPEENRRTVELSISPECLDCIDVTCINDKFDDLIMGGLEPEKAQRMILALEELNSTLKSSKK